MPSNTASKLLKWILVGVSIVGIIYYFGIAWVQIGQDPIDDSFMFMRYAKHWLSGGGFSWNTEDGPAYGITSLLYLLIVTVTRNLTHYTDRQVLTGLSFLFGLLSCITLVYLGFLASEESACKDCWLPLLIVPSLLFMPSFQFHSLSGMETTLAIFINALFACTLLFWSKHRSRNSLVGCVLLGYLSYLARPDNGIYALILPPLYFIATDKKSWRTSLQYAGLFISILILDSILKQGVLGSFVPLPFFAKSSNLYKGYLGGYKWNAMTEMLSFLAMVLPFILAVFFLSTNKVYTKLLALAIPVGLTFIYFSHVIQIMGFNARYYYPSLPFILMAAYLAIPSERVDQTTPQTMLHFSTARFLLAALFILPTLFIPIRDKVSSLWQEEIVGYPTAYTANQQYMVQNCDELPNLGWSGGIQAVVDLLRKMPANTVFAASEYGAIGSELPDIKIIDLIGLHDKYIARNGFSAEYLFSRKPDVILFPHWDYSYELASILDSNTFVDLYDYYPGAYNYGIAIRKEFASIPSIRKAMDEQFSQVYPGIELSNCRAIPVSQEYLDP